MNLEEIKKRINEIEVIGDDYTGDSHRMEDDLYKDFIIYVSKNKKYPELQKMAKEILKTENINFPRWYE